MVKELWGRILCDIMGDHDWTCTVLEGIKPTPLQLKTGLEGYKDYANMYCKRCGKQFKLKP